MTLEDRLAALESRLRAAEDHLAILNLLNSYGPLVDSGTADAAAALWVEGGTYDFGGNAGGTQMIAPEDLAAMYRSQGHLALVDNGCAHLTATPAIAVEGDTATALAYSFVVSREGERWFLWRAAVNHWVLTRTEAGWRIVERHNRVLDGSPESHATMRRVLD